ncbi:sodium/hydrogen exchanger 9B2-like isoform X2 [Planococcus citri]|uniref:sodium/hydrogen exchanger 9B2-like isoform X2 n=1 Tax=Planococcus citri TaxID=170843 RepID=UPI0031F9850C
MTKTNDADTKNKNLQLTTCNNDKCTHDNFHDNAQQSLLSKSDKIEYELQKVANNGIPSKAAPNSKSPPDLDPEKSQTPNKKLERFANPCGPKNNYILRMISFYICVAIIWGILFAFLKHEVLPGGKLLLLILLMAGAYTLGDVFKHVGLPKILGMLVCGILFRNSGLFFDSKEAGVYADVISTARQISLTCILIAAGLGLDAKSLKRLSVVVLELSFIPCIFEAVGVAIFCKLLLDLHWFWGMMIGFTMGAVSPAIVVPGLMKLQKKGYDSDNTISTIVIAAASFDDIVAISGYGIFFGLIFNQGDIFEKVIHGPIEFAGGLLIGVLWGLFSAWIPHKDDKHLVAKRVFMIGGGCLFLVLGSQMVGYDGAGPFACIVSAFVACMCWKWQGWSASYNPVADVFNSMWIIMEPALFALIGAEIDLSILRIDQVLNGSAVILGGLVFRTVACSAVLLTSTVNFKELVFINVAWLPKATVQAALGSLALDRAKTMEPRSEEHLKNGEWTLMIAVLSILLTAPIGAVGISVLGKVLLKKDKTPVNSADSNRARINNHV